MLDTCREHGFAIGFDPRPGEVGVFQVYRLIGDALEPNLDWLRQADEVWFLDDVEES